MKPAFTLPEVLVAILVFAIGILGLASSGSYIALQAGEAHAQTEGALLAGQALDSLRSTPCSAVTGGSVTSRRATFRWTAVPAARSVNVAGTLELTTRGRVRLWSMETLLPCDR